MNNGSIINEEYLNNANKNNLTKQLLRELDTEICQLSSAKNSRIFVQDCFEDIYGNIIFKLSGGLYGYGLWDDYFRDLYVITRHLIDECKINIELLELHNDIKSDLFSAYFVMGHGLKEVSSKIVYEGINNKNE